MLHIDGSGCCQDLAQVGWWEFAGGTRHTFIEWTNSSQHVTVDYNYDPYPIGQTIEYKMLYDNTPGDFTFYSDGVAIGLQVAAFTPDDAQQAGEIHTFSSQMPGDKTTNEDFTASYVYYNNGWNYFGGTKGGSSYFGYKGYNDTHIAIWDPDCP